MSCIEDISINIYKEWNKIIENSENLRDSLEEIQKIEDPLEKEKALVELEENTEQDLLIIGKYLSCRLSSEEEKHIFMGEVHFIKNF